MIRFIVIIIQLILIGCSSPQPVKNSVNGSAGMEQELQISAKLLSVEKTPNKFKVLAIIQNETGVTSFSKGDTVSLYPNFVHKEGKQINMNDPENKKMTVLQELSFGKTFNAKVRIRGRGNKRHGLIMNWSEK